MRSIWQNNKLFNAAFLHKQSRLVALWIMLLWYWWS